MSDLDRLLPENWFRGKSVLITGGLGFLGSNLAERLVRLGANVGILDSLQPESGANWFNLKPFDDAVTVTLGDVRDEDVVGSLVEGRDLVFHCAAQVSHLRGLTDPMPDIDINVRGTANLLEACRRTAPRATFVKLGSRGQYGSAERLPVPEETPQRPRGVYDWSLKSAEELTLLHHRLQGTRTIAVRLSNAYGPRGQMRHSSFGVVNYFLRLALDDATIPVFGDGRLLRDFVYVEDAVEAILRLARCRAAVGQAFNVGSDRPSSFLEVARTIVQQVGRGRWKCVPFTDERRKQEPGDFYSAIDKIQRYTGWAPTTSLSAGIAASVAYYRRHGQHYWEMPQPVPATRPAAAAAPRSRDVHATMVA